MIYLSFRRVKNFTKRGKPVSYTHLKHQNDVLNDVLKDVLQNQIIQFLTENNRLSQKQIAAKTGRSIASVQRAMKKLSEQGKIVREGGKRFGHWKVI